MNSALYVGKVRHRRFEPAGHAFSYRLHMLYLDLEELPRLAADCLFFSTRRPAPVWFRRADHPGDPAEPLEETVRSLVKDGLGRRPEGPVRLLTHPRYWGYGFNPVSFFYCHALDGTLDAVVAEVRNTPWLERHCYVLDARAAGAGTMSFGLRKLFHVSPFMPMDVDYRWSFTRPGPGVAVHMENRRDGRLFFDATLALRRRPLTPASLASALARHPFMTGKVIAAIHWQALRLWLKRVPVFTHPAKLAREAA